MANLSVHHTLVLYQMNARIVTLVPPAGRGYDLSFWSTTAPLQNPREHPQ